MAERLTAAARSTLGRRRAEEIANAVDERARQIELVEATDHRSWLARHSTAEPDAARPRRRVASAPLRWSRLEECLDRLDDRLEAWAVVAAQGAGVDSADHPVVGIKDVIDVAGLSTCAGLPLGTVEPANDDAAVVARLRARGVPLLGKPVPTPWALNDPAPTLNPWDPGRTPGGSSAGSAVAVATGMCDATVDTQTAGDVLRPAAFNGVVGLKPSAGWVGIGATTRVAPSIDTIGMIARDVTSAAALFGLLRASKARHPRIAPIRWPPRLATIEWGRERANPAVREAFDATARRLATAGAEIQAMSGAQLGIDLDAVHAAHRIVTFAECATYHAERRRTYPEQFPPRARLVLDLGIITPQSACRSAQELRAVASRAVDVFLRGCDAALLPTVGSAAPARDTTGDNSLQIPWTLCGTPAISLPMGLDPEGMPLAIQLVAPTGADLQLLGVARWCETVLDPVPPVLATGTPGA